MGFYCRMTVRESIQDHDEFWLIILTIWWFIIVEWQSERKWIQDHDASTSFVLNIHDPVDWLDWLFVELWWIMLSLEHLKIESVTLDC